MDDVKDRLEHLRTIHFGLLLTCAALGIASFENLSSQRAQAVPELTSVMNVIDTWDDHVLERPLQAQAGEGHLWPEPRHYWFEYGQHRQIATTSSQGESTVLSNLLLDPMVTFADSRSPLQRVLIRKPMTLSQFRGLWNSLDAAWIANWDGAFDGLTGEYKSSFSPQPHVKLHEGQPPSPTTRECGSLTLQLVDRRVNSFEFQAYCVDGSLSIQVTPPPQRLIGAELQAAFRQRYSVSWRSGPFASTFPALSEIPDSLQDLEFHQLMAVANEETKIATDRIEVFGAKIPIAQIAAWGLPAILCVQGYLLLHLWALITVLTASDHSTIAWIGLYRERSARAATLVTTALLPMLSTIRLALIAKDASRVHGSMLLGAVICACLFAYLTFRAFATLWLRWNPTRVRSVRSFS